MTPINAAKIMEAKLDKKFGGDYFDTVQGSYPHVKKVISNVTKEEVCDFVPMPEAKPKIKKSYDGVHYAGLKYLKKKFKEAVNDPTQEFRHKKDMASLQRIKIYEKFHKAPDNLKWKPLKKIKKQKGGINIWQ